MKERKRIIYLILIMSALVLCVGVLSNILLYRTSFTETENHLADTVKVLSNLIQSQADPVTGAVAVKTQADHSIQFNERIIQSIRHYERHNRRTELAVARREGGTIRFLAAFRHRGHTEHPVSVGMTGGLAEPMRRALEGKSGTMVGKDYHGTLVLAAYEPVRGLGLGVVAKIELYEISAPFIRTGLIIIAISLLIIIVGIIAFGRISNPIIRTLEERADKLAAANNEMERTNEELSAANEELDAANEELQAAMEEMGQTNEQLIRYQEELSRSESRVRTILDSSPVGIITAELETRRFLYANPAACAMFGYSCEEMLSVSVENIHPARDLGAIYAEFEVLSSGNRMSSHEIPCRKKDGSLFYADITAVPVEYDGRPCLLGQFIDITNRKSAEDALRESEEKFSKAFMNAPVLMSIVNPDDGTFIDANNQFVMKSGFTREELIGKNSLDVGWVVPRDRERLHEMEKRDGVVSGVALTAYPKVGGPREILYYGERINIGGNNRLLSIALDVTDLKQAEDALLRQKEMSQMYLDIAGVMFVVIGSDQIVSLVNRKGCEILGYPSDQIVGKNWFDSFIPENLREETRATFGHLMRGDVASAEYHENAIITASGEERLVAWHNTLLRDAAGTITGTLSSGEDITERKKSDDDLHNQLALNMALAGISGSIISMSYTVTEIAYMLMEYARLLTDSGHGYVSEIDPVTGDNICHALTGMTDSCPATGREGFVLFRKGDDGLYPGLWGHALNTRREFFTNDPARHPASRGLPEGHDAVTRFMSVPVLFGGNLMGQIALANSVRDYTDEDLKMARRLGSIYAMAIVRLRDETMLVKSLEEKTVLIKELHHRVKNNMQVISSLISLQSAGIDDRKYRAIFMESSNRIQAMAMVHEKMYHSGDLAHIDFSQYVREIAERLLYSFSLEQGQVALEVDAGVMFLGIDEAIPCGIIINEVVTNAFKHAFRDGRRGKLLIRITRDGDGRRRMVVHDDGPGIAPGPAGAADKSLGMQIIMALTRQLNGTLSITDSGGTRVELVF